MKEELQDLAWSCLPKEFKKEVKKEWRRAYYNDTKVILEYFFGIHNLTSDAEREEMLTVSRKEVQEMYSVFEEFKEKDNTCFNLETLFGSKCLPDERNLQKMQIAKEPQPAEPKFKMGDMVIYKRTGKKKVVFDIDKYGRYLVVLPNMQSPMYIDESDLELLPEPKEVAKMKPIESEINVYLATAEEDKEFRQLLHENGFKWNPNNSLINSSMWKSDIESTKIHFIHPDKTVTYEGDRTSDTLTFSEFKKRYFGENVNHRQNIANCDKQFDNILKVSFSKERRLNIATMIVQGVLSNPNIIRSCSDFEDSDEYIVKTALMYADTLMDECEKGGCHD